MKGRGSNQPATDEWGGDGTWTVDCSCGVTYDDGEEMVSCDSCGVWVHTRCARFVKDKSDFACHNCKPARPVDPSGADRIPSDNEETEVAQLLAELPLKTGPTSLPSFRNKWEVPLQDKVHVQGLPGGDPSLFQGNLASAFNANLWRCTGYIPKKFGFQYLEFPCWKEGKDGEEGEGREGLSKASQGADALFALSKQAEVAAFSCPQNAVRKIFKLGDTVDRANKKKEKHKARDLSLGDCSSKKKKKKDGFGEIKESKDKDRNSKKKKASSCSIDANKTCASKLEIPLERETQIEESIIPEGKSETKIEDGLVESNLSDHFVGESFGDTREEMEINKVSAEELLNLRNVSKVLDDNLPDITEKTETIQSNIVQEKMKDESKQDTIPTSDINVVVKTENNIHHSTEEAKVKFNNIRPDIVQDNVIMSQHDVSKSEETSKREPGTEESITGSAPKASCASSDPTLIYRSAGGLGSSSLTRSESTEQSKAPGLKHPIIYHAKASASSLHKSSQASKISSSSLNTASKHKMVDSNSNQLVAKPTATCHVVDESTSSTSRKQVSDTADPPPANLSDEQLALLLHQQLNSSPRVPRVPRLRHTPGVQTTHPTHPTSVLLKRSSRDHASGAKKKQRGDDGTRESSRDSVSKDSDKKLPAQQSPTVSSTEAATSNPPVEPGDCTSQKYPSLPGLIDEVLNATPHVTYDEICRNVSLHWSNLRKPNGERYAYSSPNHAVHDILRNRKEWAHLIDQAPKAYLSKKRKNVITEEKKAKSEEDKSEESESVREDFPKGKRKARKRRRLELRGKSVREARKNKEKNSGSENSSGPLDSSCDDEEGNDDDESLSSDDVFGARTAGSSSSD